MVSSFAFCYYRYMLFNGPLEKMSVKMDDVVNYSLSYGSQILPLNNYIGKEITLTYQNKIICTVCGKETKKSFSQGFCYPCFINSPEASECIIRPELCRAHEGVGRDMDWERKHHLQDHYVYLAISSGIKVGITRSTQLPNRWIDQGANRGIIIAKTPNRYYCGLIEVALKAFVSDRTSWQRMLKNDVLEDNLLLKKQELMQHIPEDLQHYIYNDDLITEITYPVLKYPTKVKSITFDKVPMFSGKLIGIKGQYLIFDDNHVFNIRRHTGYVAYISQ